MSPQMERAAGYILTCPSGGNCANMKAQQTAPAKAEKGRQKQEGNGQNMYVIAGLKWAENNSGKAADLYEPERRMYPGSAGLL